MAKHTVAVVAASSGRNLKRLIITDLPLEVRAWARVIIREVMPAIPPNTVPIALPYIMV